MRMNAANQLEVIAMPPAAGARVTRPLFLNLLLTLRTCASGFDEFGLSVVRLQAGIFHSVHAERNVLFGF